MSSAKAVAAARQKPSPPLADGGTGRAQGRRHRQIAGPFRALEDNARAQGQRLGCLMTAQPALQLLALLLGNLRNLSRVMVCYEPPPCWADDITNSIY